VIEHDRLPGDEESLKYDAFDPATAELLAAHTRSCLQQSDELDGL
jgi:hypothetical protein